MTKGLDGLIGQPAKAPESDDQWPQWLLDAIEAEPEGDLAHALENLQGQEAEPDSAALDAIASDQPTEWEKHLKGERGEKGDRGDPGRDGRDGKDGVGKDGKDGRDGADGQGIVWRGQWSEDETYAINDAVESEGSSYIAVRPNSDQKPPGAAWDLLAQAGKDAAKGAQGSPVMYNIGGANAGAGSGSGGTASDLLSPLISPEISVTTTATLTISRMHVCTGTTADYTVTLPAVASNAGKLIGIRMSASLTKLVTVAGAGGELIDGSATRIMIANEAAILLCDGATWTKVAGKSLPLSASAERQATFNVPYATVTNIPLDALNDQNQSGIVDLINGRLNILRTGWYIVEGSVALEGAFVAAAQEGFCFVCVNSPTTLPDHPSAIGGGSTSTAGGTTTLYVNVSIRRKFNAGDYVALTAYQGSGSAMDTRTAGFFQPHLNLLEAPSW